MVGIGKMREGGREGGRLSCTGRSVRVNCLSSVLLVPSLPLSSFCQQVVNIGKMVSRAKERLNLIFLCGRNAALVNELKSVRLPPPRLFPYRLVGFGFDAALLEELKSGLPTSSLSPLSPSLPPIRPSLSPSVPLCRCPSLLIQRERERERERDSLTLYPFPPDGVAGVCMHTGLHPAGLFLHAGIFSGSPLRACVKGGCGSCLDWELCAP